jgi:hypothetical protein
MKAKLAFVTQPEPGIYQINIDDGKKFQRIQISKEQLGNLIVDGSQMILRPSFHRVIESQTENEDEREYRR